MNAAGAGTASEPESVTVMDAMAEIPVLTSVNRTLVRIPGPVSNAVAAACCGRDGFATLRR